MQRTEIINRIIQRLETAGYIVGRQENGVVVFAPPHPGGGSVQAILDITLDLIWNEPELLTAVKEIYQRKEDGDEKADINDFLGSIASQ